MLPNSRVRKRILVIDEELPLPLDTGKKIRTFNLLTRISRDHEIHYVVFADSHRDRDKIDDLVRKGITVHAVSLPRKRKKSGISFYMSLALNLFSRYPYIVSNQYSREMQDAVDRLVGEDMFDWIQAETSPYAVYFLRMKNTLKTDKIFVAHNVENEIWRRYREVESNPFKRMYMGIQQRKLVRFETVLLSPYECIAVSERDADFFRRYSVHRRVHVIENGVDVAHYRSLSRESVPGTLVFTGSMDWRPNQDAVRYFVREIYPLIKSSFPDVRFEIIGRNPPDNIRAMASNDSSILVTGAVRDVRPYLERCDVFVVPLRIGGGTRLKILEAFAAGRPVVSTAIGAEGIRATPGDEIIIEDSPRGFADATIRLLIDREMAESIACRGREKVGKEYDWEIIATRQTEIYGDKR